MAKLGLLGVVVMAPLWVMLLLKWPKTIDVLFYATLIRDFSAQFWQGEWYPRWLMEINSGYGGPLFLFYGPLSFYMTNLFEWLAPFDPYGLGRLALGMQLALFISGLTCCRWLRRHFPEAQAEKGALLYAAFPYLPILIYYNYGLASLWAIALFPLLLEAIDRLRETSWRGVPRIAALFALLCLTHMPSLITFLAIPPSYAVFTAGPGRRWRHLALTGIGGLIGAALSAIYLLPMSLNRDFVRNDLFIKDTLDYSQHFWMPHTLYGLLCVILPLIGLYTEQAEAARRRVLSGLMGYWVVMLAALLFMVSPLSKFLWDGLPVLQHLQFPMRFYNAMLPGAVFIATAWQARTKGVYAGLLAIMLLMTVSASWETWFSYDKADMTDKPFIGVANGYVYQTRWMRETTVYTKEMPSGPERVAVAEGKGEVVVTHWGPREIRLHAEIAPGGALLTLRRFYFSGWAGGEITPETHGLMSLRLAAGAHDVALTLPEFVGERLGERISLVALGVLLLWVLAGCYSRKVAASSS